MITKSSLRLVLILALLIGLSIGAVGSYFFVPSSFRPPSTSTITKTSAVTALVPITEITTQTKTILGFPEGSAFINRTTGLSLGLFLNSSVIAVSGGNSSTSIQVDISEYNTLAQPNNVTAASDWELRGLSAGSCNFISPTGIVVFSGYYTLENISKANSTLSLFDPAFCPEGPLPPSVLCFPTF